MESTETKTSRKEKEEIRFAAEYARVLTKQLNDTQLMEYLGIGNWKTYQRRRDDCTDKGLIDVNSIPNIPKATIERIDELRGQFTDSQLGYNRPILKVKLQALHILISEFPHTAELNADADKYFTSMLKYVATAINSDMADISYRDECIQTAQEALDYMKYILNEAHKTTHNQSVD